MKLFTSNYARHGRDPNAVCISARPPNWYQGRCYFDLAPTWDLIKGVKKNGMSERDYTLGYLKLLRDRKLDANKVVEDLGDNAIMLCYEAPQDFCHRHIAAIWIQEHTGVKVYEHFFFDRIQHEENVDKLFES